MTNRRGTAVGTTGAGDLLEALVAAAQAVVAERRSAVRDVDLDRAAEVREPRAEEFRATLSRTDRLRVIAECKRRSPSKGVLRRDYDPAQVAKGYARAGAAAVSVLTEPTFFDGSLDHLRLVRAEVDVPLLRKDFVVSEYQLLETRAAGGDAALLIVAALDDRLLRTLVRAADGLQLATLVEVHDEGELDRAIAAGATVIGVNNRNLRTMEVAVDTSRRLIELMPAAVTAVAESGLRSSEDLRELREAGYRAFLVGEALMCEPDPGEALAALLGG